MSIKTEINVFDPNGVSALNYLNSTIFLSHILGNVEHKH